MTVDAPVAPSRPSGSPVVADRLPYLPAIDGLRTLALAAVLLDHGGVTSVVGGHLGVTVFFALSGFLITALLLQERQRTGGIDLRAFWARRARRLVPASLLFVAFVLAYLAWSPARPPSTVLGDGIASLAWLANWRFVLTDRSYGDLFADPTPFAHLWSLAVEEQFYIVLPVVASLLLGRRHGRGGGHALFGAVLLVVIAGSTLLAWQLYGAGEGSVRAYYGTDTRVAELAVGSLLAVLLIRPRGLVAVAARWRAPLSALGGGALVAIGWLILQVDVGDPFNYRGGLLLVAVLSAVVVVGCTQPGSALARLLAAGPLPYLGRLTYGAYLFHWPIFLWCDERTLGVGGPALLVVRVGLTFTAAYVSYRLVEQPFRFRSLPARVPGVAWANASVGLVAALAVVAGSIPAGAVLEATDEVPPPPPAPGAPLASGPAAANGEPPGVVDSEPRPASSPTPVRDEGAEPSELRHRAADDAPPEGDAETAAPSPGGQQAPPSTAPPEPPGPALKVAVVGDSLAKDLGNGLLAWAEGRHDVSIYNLGIPACPISRGGTRRFPDGSEFIIREQCGWWDDPATERYRNLFTFDPDIVLVEDALNEIVDRKLPEWPDYRRVGDPRFDAWLLDEYRRAAQVFSSQGATVVFADAPCADWQRLPRWDSLEDPDRRVAALNRIYDNIVGATTEVAGLHDRICPDGRYSDTVEGVADARPDGFHLSDEAGRLLAERWLAPFLWGVADSRPWRGGPAQPAPTAASGPRPAT